MSLLGRNNKSGALTVTGQGTQSQPRSLIGTGTCVKLSQGAAAAALARATAALGVANLGPKESRVLFLMDATGSRSSAWAKAAEIVKGMFGSIAKVGHMQMRLMDYGNPGDITDGGWVKTADAMAELISKVSCRGGVTQINDCIMRAVSGDKRDQPTAIIFIGDNYEETMEALQRTIAVLKDKKIKVFVYQDAHDLEAAEAFRMLAEETGGKFAPLGAGIDMAEFCKGVALQATGGDAALSLANSAVRQLLLGPAR